MSKAIATGAFWAPTTRQAGEACREGHDEKGAYFKFEFPDTGLLPCADLLHDGI